MNAPPVLAVRELRAGHGAQLVLHDVDVEILRGEWLGLLGPNGSGKSSLIACLTGQLIPRGGQIRLAGFDVVEQALDARARLGHAVPPETLPSALTGWQCLQVHAAAKRLSAIDADVVEFAQALRMRERLDDMVGTYSFGTRQKLCVLLALLGKPALIVLDETFNGLDPASALCLKRHLRTRVDAGASVLLATHSLDVIEHYADRAVLLCEGRIAGSWDRAALQALRAGRNGEGLEAAMADAIERATAGA